MQNLAKTIQIFLPDGNARSIRIADITSRTVQAIQIPRNKLGDVASRKEVKSVGIYFLFGEDEDGSKPQVYIGESENCYNRIKQHNKDPKKDFWNASVIVTSKTNSFTKTHGKYLEWISINTASEASRYTLSQVIPSKPSVTESMEADLLDNLDAIKILLSTLGFPVLEKVSKPKTTKDILYCKRRNFKGQGEYIEDGFVVFKGSKAKPKESDKAPNWIINLRKQLVENGILIFEGDFLVFKNDHIFKSPSAAAASIFGVPANGWVEWKDANGKTLDELKRM